MHPSDYGAAEGRHEARGLGRGGEGALIFSALRGALVAVSSSARTFPGDPGSLMNERRTNDCQIFRAGAGDAWTRADVDHRRHTHARFFFGTECLRVSMHVDGWARCPHEIGERPRQWVLSIYGY